MFYWKMCTFHQIFRGHFWFLAVWNFFCNILIPDSVHQAHIFSYQFLSLSGLSGHIKKCPHHYNLLYQWLKKKRKMAVVKSRNFILPILFLASISSSILSFCQGATKVTEVGQAFLREPFDQIAIVGEHVTLPCRVVNKRGVLQWTRDDFGLGTDRNLTGFKRYRMSGSDEEGK